MKTRLFKMAAFSLALMMAISSCKKTNSGNGPGTDPGEPNTVKGKVVDAQGNPLAGVKVRAVNPNGINMFAEGLTDANGNYKIPVTPLGGWTIMAWKEAAYKGKTFYLRLGMKNDADYSAFATNGGSVTRDFVWKLTGRIADRTTSPENGWGYFGGCLRFVNDNGVVGPMTAGTKVTVTLAPTAGAKYLDGTNATAAGTITKTFTMASGTNNYYITDIPVTEYHMSIESELNGVRKQVYIGGNNYNLLNEWLEFDFNPAPGSGGSYESGIITPNDFPYYMGQHP
jgi:hypothetical protein